MPPKLSSAEQPRQIPAAGTSIRCGMRKSNHNTTLAAAPAAVRAPPSTSTLTSPESSQKSVHANSSVIKSPTDQSDVPTPLSQSHFSNLEKTVAGNLGLVKSGSSVVNCSDNADTVTSVEPEKGCSLEIETMVGNGHGVTSEHILAYGHDERSFGPGSGESGVVVPGHGKKKIVKRTVRVVRRVMRKRVPKRVLMDGSENQENGVVLNEVRENLNHSDLKENDNKSNKADEATETSNFNIDASVLEPTIDNRYNDLLVHHTIGMDKLKGDDVLAREGSVRVPDLMEVEKVNSAAKSTLKSDWRNGIDDPTTGNVNSAVESAVQSELTAGVAASMIDNALGENWRLDEGKRRDVDEVIDQMVNSVTQACIGPLGDQNQPLMGNTSGGKYEGEVKISEDVEGKNVPFNKRLLLGGELEALERKKRRKTEIFVGG